MPSSSKVTEDGVSPAASNGALAGVLLLFGGLGGIVLYIASILPPVVQFFGTMAGVGAVLVAKELKLNDQLACGVSIGDLLAHLIRLWQAVCYQMVVLFSLPDITSADVSIVWQGVATQASGATAEKSTRPNTTEAAPAQRATELGVASLGRTPERSFVLAKHWLQRPDLKMGLGEQLSVYGLYQRAQSETFGERLAASASKADTCWLERAKFEAKQACTSISQAAARARLASAVAAADPLFVAAHPEFAMPRPGDHAGMLLSLAERRMPRNLGESVAVLHRRALAASAAMAVAASLRWAWLRAGKAASPRRLLAWLVAAALGAAGSGYGLALVTGVPLEVHVAIVRLFGVSSKERSDGGAVARLRQYLTLLLAPRPQRSLFSQP